MIFAVLETVDDTTLSSVGKIFKTSVMVWQKNKKLS